MRKLPNIVFLGAPGSGKGSQAARIVEDFGYLHISTGDLFRRAVADDNPLGRLARELLSAGKLLPDSVATQLVAEALAFHPYRPFLLDGFPRTLPQAVALEDLLGLRRESIDIVIRFVVPRQVLLERISGRLVDPTTNRIYHETSNPPPPTVAATVRRRLDDTAQAASTRLDEYQQIEQLLVQYFEQRRVVRPINGAVTFAEATRQIASVIMDWQTCQLERVETHQTLAE